jgi:hypothetical protein
MCANPHPDEIRSIFYGYRSMTHTYSGRPESTDLLEAERWVLRVRFQQLKVLSRYRLN